MVIFIFIVRIFKMLLDVFLIEIVPSLLIFVQSRAQNFKSIPRKLRLIIDIITGIVWPEIEN